MSGFEQNSSLGNLEAEACFRIVKFIIPFRASYLARDVFESWLTLLSASPTAP